MRRSGVVFLILVLGLFTYAIYSTWTLLTLLAVTGASDAITREELYRSSRSSAISNSTSSQLIPKIIHQTFKNSSIPAHWVAPQKSCIDLHPDYEYKFWTDETARAFIASKYPSFLYSFDNYPFNIQRADAIRYFLLVYYGGIYIDLDDGCKRRLDPLLSYPAWVRRTLPTGISNDAMGSVPAHPFFVRVIDSLPKYDRSWILPYVTVMGSTGPLFLSIIWRQFDPREKLANRVRILFPDEYSNREWSFFFHNRGSSWHQGDVHLIFWMAHYWMFLTSAGFVVVALVTVCAWMLYSRMLRSGSYSNKTSVRERGLMTTIMTRMMNMNGGSNRSNNNNDNYTTNYNYTRHPGRLLKVPWWSGGWWKAIIYGDRYAHAQAQTNQQRVYTLDSNVYSGTAASLGVFSNFSSISSSSSSTSTNNSNNIGALVRDWFASRSIFPRSSNARGHYYELLERHQS